MTTDDAITQQEGPAQEPAPSRRARATKSTASTGSTVVVVPSLEVVRLRLRIVGDSPLVVHAWSEKAVKMMLDKQMGAAATKREFKDPMDDYEQSFYRLPDGRYGFPTIAFKAAAVSAASQVDGLTKVFLRGAFHTMGELVAIEGEPVVRRDMVRVGMGAADIRFRPEFQNWACWLPIRLNARALTTEALISLFNQAGFSCGVGEYRPEKDGSWGMFHVEAVEELR